MKQFLKNRTKLGLALVALMVLYLGFNLPFFNELVHSAIKSFAVIVTGVLLRRWTFSKTLKDYVENGDLEKDLNGLYPDSFGEAEERLKHYRLMTVICFAIPALMYILA